MPNTDVIKRIYKNAQPEFTDIGTFEEFQSKLLGDSETRKKIHKNLRRVFTDVGTLEEFEARIGVEQPFMKEMSEVPMRAHYQSLGVLADVGLTVEDLLGVNLPGDPRAVKEYAEKEGFKYMPTRHDLASKMLSEGASTGLMFGMLSLPVAAGALAAGVSSPLTALTVGGLGAAGMFGLAEYNSFMDDFVASVQEKDGIELTPEQIDKIRDDPRIQKLAGLSAFVEGGFELLATALEAKIFGLIGGKATEVLSKGIKNSVVRALGRIIKAEPLEVSTEIIQAELENALRKEAGIETGMTLGQPGLEVAPVAFGATFMMGGAAEVASRLLKPVKSEPDKIVEEEHKKEVAKAAERDFKVGEIVTDATGDQCKIVSVSDPDVPTLERISDGSIFKAGWRTLAREGEPVKVGSRLLKQKMIEVGLPEDRVTAVMKWLEAAAYHRGMTLDQLTIGWFRDVRFGPERLAEAFDAADKEGAQFQASYERAFRGADKTYTKGKMRSPVMGTEGQGIYVTKDSSLAEFFGTLHKVKYKKPKKQIHADLLPLLFIDDESMDEVLFGPPRKGDSEWVLLHKQAVKNVGATTERFDVSAVSIELTRLLREKGYDAVDVDDASILTQRQSGGWTVLLDEDLLISMEPVYARDRGAQFQTGPGVVWYSELEKTVLEEFPWKGKDTVKKGALAGFIGRKVGEQGRKQLYGLNREMKWRDFHGWLARQEDTITKAELNNWLMGSKLDLDTSIRGGPVVESRATPIIRELELENPFSRDRLMAELNEIKKTANKEEALEIELYEMEASFEEMEHKSTEYIQDMREKHAFISAQLRELRANIRPAKYENQRIGGPIEAFYNLHVTVPWLPTSYSGGHFPDVLNPIGWALADVRKYPDGSLGLNLSEIQSDWAKEGEKEKVGIRNFPFPKNWHTQVIRRALKWAADQGFDRLTFSTGEMISEKYQITRVVDRISYAKMDEDEEAWKGKIDLIGIKNDEVVFSKMVYPSKLSDYVGTEIANKIIKGESSGLTPGGYKILETEDLTIGNRWAYNLYDKEFINGINPWLKEEFGVEVGKTEMNTGPRNLTEEEEEDQDELLVLIEGPSVKKTVHSIPITPDMKRSIPSFQQEGDVPYGMVEFDEEGKAIITMGEQATVATMMHEIWHVFETHLTSEENRLMWDVFGEDSTHEERARAFERYLRIGRTANKKLDAVFAKFKTWLTNIYKRIKGSPLEMKYTPAMRNFFDSLIADEVINTGVFVHLDGASRRNAFQAASNAEKEVGDPKENPIGAASWMMTKMQKWFDIEGFWGTVNTEKGNAKAVGTAIKMSEATAAIAMNDADVLLNGKGVELLKGKKGGVLRIIQSLRGRGIALLMSGWKKDTPNWSRWLESAHPSEKDAIIAASDAIRNYYDKCELELERRGILEGGFVENLLKTLEERLVKATMSGNMEMASALELAIDVMKDAKFSSIALSWFANKVQRDPAGSRSILRYVTTKRRKIWNLDDLLEIDSVDEDGNVRKDENGDAIKAFRIEDLTPSDAIRSYARRFGRDIALNDVVVAMDRAGVAMYVGSPRSKTGKVNRAKALNSGAWVSPPGRAPALRDYVLKPFARDAIEEMTWSDRRGTWIEKMFGIAKGMQFINPIRMAGNDLVQQTMRFGLGPLKGIKYLNLAKRGLKQYNNGEDTELAKSVENIIRFAIFSKPIGNPFGSFEESTRWMEADSLGKQIAVLLKDKSFGKVPNPLKAVYTIAWKLAWGLDEIIRTASGLRMMDEGMGAFEAAQEAAMFHGDYASVPFRTRRVLNKIFFTPTFKIVMTKLYGRMMLGAIDTVGMMKSTDEKRRYAMGLVWTTGIALGIHMFMRSLGFEPDELFRRYTARIDTDEGPRELAVSLTSPATMFLKYKYMVEKALSGDLTNAPTTLFWSLKWDLHPILRVAHDIGINRKPDGKDIADPFDHPLLQALKGLKYGVTSIIPLFMLPQSVMENIDLSNVNETTPHYAFVDKVGNRLRNRAIAQLMSFTMSLYSFKYLRGTKEQRVGARIRQMQSQLRRSARENPDPAKMERKVRNFLHYVNREISELDL